MSSCTDLEVDPITWTDVKCGVQHDSDYEEIHNWLRVSIDGYYFVTADSILFENEQDAVLFKLRFC